MPLTRENLISQYENLHQNKLYGYTSEKLLNLLLPYIEEIEAKSILDYGCGQSNLLELIKTKMAAQQREITTYKYDPALPELEQLPNSKVDLVLCTDVLEHIPCTDLDEVVEKILALGEQALFVVSTRKAVEKLEDGRNAHCSVYKAHWWLALIRQYAPAARLAAWPLPASCLITTWHSGAVGGKLDAIIKYLAGNADKIFQK